MYSEDSVRYLLDPSPQALSDKKDQWLHDCDYLPSHLTRGEREQKLAKHPMFVEKDFRVTARQLAEVCEHSIYEKLPELKNMIRLQLLG